MSIFKSRNSIHLVAFCAILASVASRCFSQVPGDVSGDGTLSLLDSAMIKDHLLERKSLTGTALARADADHDGKVRMADFVYVQNHLSAPVVASNVIVVDSTPNLTALDWTSPTLILRWTGTGAHGIDPNDILVGSAFNGFLRRVNSVSANGEILTIQTGEASLAQVIKSGQPQTARIPLGAPRFASDRVRAVTKGGAETAKAGWSRIQWNLSGTVLYRDSNVTIDLPTAAITFDPMLDIAFAIEQSHLKYFRAEAGGDFTLNLEARVSAEISGEWDKEIPIPGTKFQQVYVQFIGIVPVVEVVTFELVAKAHLEGSASAVVRPGFTYTLPVRVGAEYTNGQWRQLVSPQPGPPVGRLNWQASADAMARVAVAPTISVELYSVAGPNFALEPYLEFDAHAQLSPPLFNYSLSAGVDALLGFRFHILDQTLLEKQFGPWNLWSVELLAGSRSLPPSQTITIDVTPDAGQWTLTGPAGFTTGNGTGDRTGGSAITGAPPGNYTLTCSDNITGYNPPPPNTQTLPSGGTINFAPVYSREPQTGTITIDVFPNAGSWRLTGPAGFTMLNGSGDRLNATAIRNAPPGNYTLTCNDNVAGYNPPSPQTRSLAVGATLAFTATWTAEPPQTGTITIDVTPNTGSWTLTGPAGFTTINGTGDRLAGSAITNCPAGQYTLSCNDNVTSYTPPAPDTKTLASGGTVAFTPTYAPESGPNEITINLPGNVPLVLVRIPAGNFQMGSPVTERSRYSNEGPVHTVTINYAFYMGKYELTQKQWLAVMSSWPGTAPSSTYGLGDNYPAYYVSWNDAQNFLTALNTHITNTGQGPATFRLPSEAEWEYACRAGTQTRFFFGDSLSVGDSNKDGPAGTLPGNRSDYMWYSFNYNTPTYGCKQVGTKLPNQFGLYDMSGNVWEWCQDWWHNDYTGAPTNGSAWESPAGSYRVVRGGPWGGNAAYCRSAFRSYAYPDARFNFLGFRFVRTQ